MRAKRGLLWTALLLLAALLFLAGCGGEFWGSVGDWEPGELGLAAPPAAITQIPTPRRG